MILGAAEKIQQKFTFLFLSFSFRIACFITGKTPTKFPESFFGLIKGASTPNFFTKLIIFLSSLETIILSNNLDCFAANIDQ